MQKILITAGGTEEPIDGVRTISNFSTGKTGAVLASFFHNKGYNVTLLTSLRAIVPEASVKIEKYQSFNDLNNLLIQELKTGDYSVVIHAAAVSDYSVDYLLNGDKKLKPDTNLKLDSKQSLSITLKPNFKIIDKIKSYSPRDILLIGFKLTKNANKELIDSKLKSIFKSEEVDFVVHNDLTLIEKNKHKATIYNRNKALYRSETKDELAENLLKIIKEQ